MTGCAQQEKADLIIFNAKVYTVNDDFDVEESMAVRNGKVLEVGSSERILNKYTALDKIDLDGNYVYPGFYDAHCHFYGYGRMKVSQADLTGTTSFDEVLTILIKHAKEYPAEWIRGRGWDQNDWEDTHFPDKKKLDELFPQTPVYLTRIDGHAALCNSKALKMAGISTETKVNGGEIIMKDGEPSGILIDNAMDLVYAVIPVPGDDEIIRSLKKAEEDCFSYGLTSVADAGLSYEVVQLIDGLHQSGDLKMRIYAMLSPEEKNFSEYVAKGPYLTNYLTIRSIKLYADGALGSRGAKLIEPYHDRPETNGLLLQDPKYFKDVCMLAKQHGYQVNTHAIGDSANRMLLHIYGEFLGEKNDLRWRIEHAQVVDPEDFELFGRYNIVPSVQPTHATSDMYWADERLGPERIKNAYAYHQLLNENGWIPLGTDFPVEQVNPFLTFYAAIARKDISGYPENGFQIENALSREDALRGMTIWAAKASFEEDIKGSLEPGKFADFIVLKEDLMIIDPENIPSMEVQNTYLNGEAVFSR